MQSESLSIYRSFRIRSGRRFEAVNKLGGACLLELVVGEFWRVEPDGCELFDSQADRVAPIGGRVTGHVREWMGSLMRRTSIIVCSLFTTFRLQKRRKLSAIACHND